MAEAVTIPIQDAGKDPGKVPENTGTTDKGVTISSEQPATEAAKPVWEQHGFKSADEMGKAYGELRTKMSKEGAPKDEPKKEEPAKDDKKEEAPAPSKEFGAKEQAEVLKLVGGQEQYDQMLDWAKVNLTEAQAKAFDDAINSNNVEAAKLAVEGLSSRYRAAVGTEGKLIGGDSTPATSGIEPFESVYEMTQAMNDPRYKNGDVKFIKNVERRLSVSKILG